MTSSLIKLEPDELIKAIRANPTIMSDIVSNPETGASYLRHADAQASAYYKVSQEAYTRCILWLHIIRENQLYKFGGFKNWTHYIETWIQDGAKGRTMVLGSLKAVRIWTSPQMDLEPEALLDYQEGIASIEPLFDPKYGIVEEYNNRTGEVFRLKDEWEAKLEGTTPQEKLKAFIAELPHETTKVQTLNTVASEGKPPTNEFIPDWLNNQIVGFCWKLYDKEGHLFYEGSVACKEMWDKARELGVQGDLVRKFGFSRDWMVG